MTPLPKIFTLQIWVRISIFNKHPPTSSVSLFWKLNRLDGPSLKWWLPLSFKAKVKSHPVTSGTLPDLVLSTSLTSSPWSPITLFAPATLASLMFPKHTRHAPNSGILHLFFFLFIVLFPQISACLSSLFPLSLIAYVTFSVRATLTAQFKIANPPPHSFPSFFALFSPEQLSCYFLISLTKDKLHKSRKSLVCLVHIYNSSTQASAGGNIYNRHSPNIYWAYELMMRHCMESWTTVALQATGEYPHKLFCQKKIFTGLTRVLKFPRSQQYLIKSSKDSIQMTLCILENWLGMVGRYFANLCRGLNILCLMQNSGTETILKVRNARFKSQLCHLLSVLSWSNQLRTPFN